jgi:hypothetical protein
VGSAVKSFAVVVEFEELVCFVLPERLLRRAVRGLEAQPPGMDWVFSELPLPFPGELCFLGQPDIRKRTNKGSVSASGLIRVGKRNEHPQSTDRVFITLSDGVGQSPN